MAANLRVSSSLLRKQQEDDHKQSSEHACHCSARRCSFLWQEARCYSIAAYPPRHGDGFLQQRSERPLWAASMVQVETLHLRIVSFTTSADQRHFKQDQIRHSSWRTPQTGLRWEDKMPAMLGCLFFLTKGQLNPESCV